MKQPSATEAGIPTITGNVILQNVLAVVYWAAGLVAVIMVILAAYLFLTANGDQSKMVKARQCLLAMVIGLIVAISAFLISNFVVENI